MLWRAWGGICRWKTFAHPGCNAHVHWHHHTSQTLSLFDWTTLKMGRINWQQDRVPFVKNENNNNTHGIERLYIYSHEQFFFLFNWTWSMPHARAIFIFIHAQPFFPSVCAVVLIDTVLFIYLDGSQMQHVALLKFSLMSMTFTNREHNFHFHFRYRFWKIRWLPWHKRIDTIFTLETMQNVCWIIQILACFKMKA